MGLVANITHCNRGSPSAKGRCANRGHALLPEGEDGVKQMRAKKEEEEEGDTPEYAMLDDIK